MTAKDMDIAHVKNFVEEQKKINMREGEKAIKRDIIEREKEKEKDNVFRKCFLDSP